MQIKRNNRYAIHYPAGAGGDFLAACIYLVSSEQKNDWRSHTSIDDNGKVRIGKEYQLEFQKHFFPKSYYVKNTDISIEDYLIITNNSNNYLNFLVEYYGENINNKPVEIAVSHVLYNNSKSYDIYYKTFIQWCGLLNFNKQFYIEFSDKNEALESYVKYIMKDQDIELELQNMSSHKLSNIINFLTHIMEKQKDLKERKFIGIPYSTINSGPLEIAKELSKHIDCYNNEQFINFVTTYIDRNNKDKTQTNVNKFNEFIKKYIENFEEIYGNSKRKST